MRQAAEVDVGHKVCRNSQEFIYFNGMVEDAECPSSVK
jgi:hypothetical protein